MKVPSDMSGLKKLAENAKKLHGTSQVPLADVLNAKFVSSHSKYADFEALLAAVGVTTKEEFEALPDAEFDAFIAANTDFSNWVEMQTEGMTAYAKAQLLKGL